MPCINNSSGFKVHISACPSERYLYFDKVQSYLSALKGVEVSFCLSPLDGENNLPNDATHLVILATEKYFTTKNSGYLSEYLKASERGIVVIPLLFEEGIINLINTRFKKTQHISMFNSFEEGLQKLSLKLTENYQEMFSVKWN